MEVAESSVQDHIQTAALSFSAKKSAGLSNYLQPPAFIPPCSTCADLHCPCDVKESALSLAGLMRKLILCVGSPQRQRVNWAAEIVTFKRRRKVWTVILFSPKNVFPAGILAGSRLIISGCEGGGGPYRSFLPVSENLSIVFKGQNSH